MPLPGFSFWLRAWYQLLCDFVFQILKSFAAAEKRRKPSPSLLFTDVYKEVPPHLQKRLKEMKDHVTKYKEHYPLSRHEPM